MTNRIISNFALVVLIGCFLLRFGGDRLVELSFLDRTEELLYDLRLGYLSQPRKNDEIVIVDIDNASLKEVGRWPWRRDVVGVLVRRLLDKHQAGLVIFTVQFPESDNVGVQIMSELREEFRFEPDTQNAIDNIASEYDFDISFAKALDGRKVLLSYYFTLGEGIVGGIPQASILLSENGRALSRERMSRAVSEVLSYQGYVGNLRQIQTAALGAGHLTPIIDQDGSIRKTQLIANFRGVPYESLALSALRFGSESRKTITAIREDSILRGFIVDSKRIPINGDGTIYVNYYGTGGPGYGNFEYISAASLLRETGSTKDLSGKIVVVGSSSQRLNALRATPLNPELPGVEVFATSLANLMEGDLLYRPTSIWLNEMMLFFALGLCLSVIMPFLGPLISLPVVALAMYGVLYINLGFWTDAGHVYLLFPFMAMVVALFIWNLSVGFMIEYRATRRIQGVLGQYLPPALAKRMSKSKRSIAQLKGEERELSILFSDVRNFTTISEQFEPQDLSKFMNQMLTVLSERIHAHNGTIDKYIGDAVMAFWGAPLEDPDHARNSVLAALEMQIEMSRLSVKLEKMNFPSLKLGIGICTGLARVGNMGSNIRLNYTAMGDSVNTASRLEGITKHYDVPVLVSERTAEAIGLEGKMVFREIDTIRVKGKAKPIKIYQPMGQRQKLNSFDLTRLDEYHEALEMYKNRDFGNSLQRMNLLCERFPEDGLYRAYAERLHQLATEGVPADWEPVYSFMTK